MLKCIVQKLCELIGITGEKVNQIEELNEQADLIIEQQNEICGCLETVIGTEDTVCPECENGLINKMFRFFGFDEGNGFFNEEEYVMSVSVNGGTATSQGPSAGDTKSSNYTNAYAAINAVEGWSITMVNDVLEADNGKVEHIVEYIGAPGSVLEVVNNHNGDKHVFTVGEDGSCTGVSTTGDGDLISSPTIIVLE